MRKLTPYELNQLRKHGIDTDSLSDELVGAKTFSHLRNRIEKSEPIEYITGFAEFRGNDFKVTKDTLIPRVETEEMVDIALNLLSSPNKSLPSPARRGWSRPKSRPGEVSLEKKNDPIRPAFFKEGGPPSPKRGREKHLRFADIGTGSGAIGISFALELINKKVSFEGWLSDNSEKALEVARENLARLVDETTESYRQNINIINSNLLQDYPKEKKFNIIFANLPYIPSERINKLDRSVKDFEPLSALDGGKSGLKYILKLLDQAPNHLVAKGFILLEVDDTHDEKITKKHKGKLKNWDIEIKKDQNNKNRFWVCKLKSNSKTQQSYHTELLLI